MARYSVADAKNGLPRLIDRALAGDQVVITRHGKPVAELTPVREDAMPTDLAGSLAWLKARALARPAVAISSVDLLNEIYEAED